MVRQLHVLFGVIATMISFSNSAHASGPIIKKIACELDETVKYGKPVVQSKQLRAHQIQSIIGQAVSCEISFDGREAWLTVSANDSGVMLAYASFYVNFSHEGQYSRLYVFDRGTQAICRCAPDLN